MAKRMRSSKRTNHQDSPAPAIPVPGGSAPGAPRVVVPRPRHFAQVGLPRLPGEAERWTERPEGGTARRRASASAAPPLRSRSPWQVHNGADLFAFFGPLLSCIVGCQALVVILLGQQLSDPSWLALLALFLGMLVLDHLAIHPLLGQHHRKFQPRLLVHLGASALPALALIVIRRLA